MFCVAVLLDRRPDHRFPTHALGERGQINRAENGDQDQRDPPPRTPGDIRKGLAGRKKHTGEPSGFVHAAARAVLLTAVAKAATRALIQKTCSQSNPPEFERQCGKRFSPTAKPGSTSPAGRNKSPSSRCTAWIIQRGPGMPGPYESVCLSGTRGMPRPRPKPGVIRRWNTSAAAAARTSAC